MKAQEEKMFKDKVKELEESERLAKDMKMSHAKQLQDLSDRIAVLKLGQGKTTQEMKGVKSELKIER